jgi:hypothetical protein
MKNEMAIISVVFSASMSLVLGLLIGGIVNRPTEVRHKAKIHKLSEDYQHKINELSGQLQVYSAEINGLKNQNSLSKKELSNKEAEIENIKHELRDIKKTFDDQSIELHGLKEELNNVIEKPNQENEELPPQKGDVEKAKQANKNQDSVNSKSIENISPVGPYGSPHTVLSEDFFGVYLGGYIRRNKLNGKEIPFKDKDDPTRLLGVYSSNSAVKDMYARVKEYEVRKGHREYKVYSLIVFFNDSSQINFDAIKSGIEKKYGIENQADVFDAIDGKAKYYVPIDGIVVSIILQRKDNFDGNVDFWISYRHLPLVEELNKTMRDRKAQKVQSDL